MKDFEQCIREMLDLVTIMTGDVPLDTNRYIIKQGLGIKDDNTGVMLLVDNALVGTLGEVVHPQIDPKELEKHILNLGYAVKERDDNFTRYVLESECEGLPDIIAIGCEGKGISNCELHTTDRKKVLTPLKTLFEYLLNYEQIWKASKI